MSQERIRQLVVEGKNILANPEQVYDLAGKRLALYAIWTKPVLTSRPFRLAIIGNPNRGKTTLAYNYYLALREYEVPTTYIDLDLYSQSGLAISGQIDWDKRLKRNQVTQKEINELLRHYKKISSGLVIGDFPGKVNNPAQEDRLAISHLALVLGDHPSETRQWMALAAKTKLQCLHLRSRPDRELSLPIIPTAYDLNRSVRPFTVQTLIQLTRILEEVAETYGLASDPWPIFREAERMVLEEVLDFEFEPWPEKH